MTAPPLDILYVDDEPDLREIVSAALEMDGGFTVHACADADAAWQRIALRRPDLIILDVMMPDTDGPALFAALKQNSATQAVPVVFMTAKVLEPELDRLRALDPAGILQKPFDPRTLANDIRRYCPAPILESEPDIGPLLEEMRARFRAEAFETARSLSAGRGLQAEDPAGALYIAHALCGTAGTLGFEAIAEAAAAIDAAQAGTLLDARIDALAALLRAMAPLPDKPA